MYTINFAFHKIRILSLDTVVDCGIEPGGSKLVVIHGEGARSSASFYDLHDSKGQLSCLSKLICICFVG